MPKMLIDQTVEDVYTLVVEKPPKVSQGSVLKDAVDAIIGNPISQKVYIVDREEKLIGQVSMKSLLKQTAARLGTRESGLVSLVNFWRDILHEDVEHFSEKPMPIRKDTKLTEAMKLMVTHGINDLPVIDRDGKLLGELNGLEILVAARKLFKDKSELESKK